MVFFTFVHIFYRIFWKQTVETLIRCRFLVASDLVLHCFPMSHKKDARLIWVNPFKLMNFPISIDRTSLFQILGVLSGTFHFYSKVHRIFCRQTVVTLIRHCVLRRLIWANTICLCPTKRTLGLCRLTTTESSSVVVCSTSD